MAKMTDAQKFISKLGMGQTPEEFLKEISLNYLKVFNKNDVNEIISEFDTFAASDNDSIREILIYCFQQHLSAFFEQHIDNGQEMGDPISTEIYEYIQENEDDIAGDAIFMFFGDKLAIKYINGIINKIVPKYGVELLKGMLDIPFEK